MKEQQMLFLWKNYEECMKYYEMLEYGVEKRMIRKYTVEEMERKWDEIRRHGIKNIINNNTWIMHYDSIYTFPSYYSWCKKMFYSKDGITRIFMNANEKSDVVSLFIIRASRMDMKKLVQRDIRVECNGTFIIDCIVKVMKGFIEIRIKPFPIKYACNGWISVVIPDRACCVEKMYALQTVFPHGVRNKLYRIFKMGTITYDDHISVSNFGINSP